MMCPVRTPFPQLSDGSASEQTLCAASSHPEVLVNRKRRTNVPDRRCTMACPCAASPQIVGAARNGRPLAMPPLARFPLAPKKSPRSSKKSVQGFRKSLSSSKKSFRAPLKSSRSTDKSRQGSDKSRRPDWWMPAPDDVGPGNPNSITAHIASFHAGTGIAAAKLSGQTGILS